MTGDNEESITTKVVSNWLSYFICVILAFMSKRDSVYLERESARELGDKGPILAETTAEQGEAGKHL